MAKIVSFGGYIPRNRLSRAEIAKIWDGIPIKGEKAVANYDEDSVTMAVAAAIDCTLGIDRKSIGGLFFASTTPPYREKQSAAIISAALGLDKETLTIDFSNSIRCGTNALKVAMDVVDNGFGKNVLVCASDTRLALPSGRMEMLLGDGAAAILVGNNQKGLATIDFYYTLSDEFHGIWRSEDDRFVSLWEERFIRENYSRIVTQAVSTALKKGNLRSEDFSKVIFNAPDSRQLGKVAQELGFDPKSKVQDLLDSSIGDAGSSLPFILFIGGLEEAQPGDRILLAAFGDGCDVLFFTVNEEIGKNRDNKGGIKKYFSDTHLLSYSKYLRWRNLIELQPPARPSPEQSSAVALYRDKEAGLSLHGVKCLHCGTPQYPKQRICINCGVKDLFEDYSFSDKVGKISAFSHDNLALSVDPPITVVSVDFPEGGRIICDMTDRIPEKVKVGMPVEMTYRVIRVVNGIHTYWWKCRPVSGK